MLSCFFAFFGAKKEWGVLSKPIRWTLGVYHFKIEFKGCCFEWKILSYVLLKKDYRAG